MAEKIVVSIPAKGDITFEGKGFKGKSCLTEVEDVMKRLGKVTEQKKTPDYHKTPENKVKVNQ